MGIKAASHPDSSRTLPLPPSLRPLGGSNINPFNLKDRRAPQCAGPCAEAGAGTTTQQARRARACPGLVGPASRHVHHVCWAKTSPALPTTSPQPRTLGLLCAYRSELGAQRDYGCQAPQLVKVGRCTVHAPQQGGPHSKVVPTACPVSLAIEGGGRVQSQVQRCQGLIFKIHPASLAGVVQSLSIDF